MTGQRCLVGAVALSIIVAACTAAPPLRMDTYLGLASDSSKITVSKQRTLSSSRLETGLLVINDTNAPRAAPSLSQEALSFLTDRTQQQLERDIPIKVIKALPPNASGPTGGTQDLVRLMAQETLDYLVLMIVSSAESEVPVQLSLGGPESVSVPGSHLKNFSLVEVALLEGQSGAAIIRAHGQAWATLTRLVTSGRSHQYPVIHRSSRVAPIFPKADQAPDLLRALAGEEALEQAVMHFEEAWAEAFPPSAPAS